MSLLKLFCAWTYTPKLTTYLRGIRVQGEVSGFRAGSHRVQDLRFRVAFRLYEGLTDARAVSQSLRA